MSDRVIPDLGYENDTKKRIITEAIKLFALKGFSAVSTRDIARMVGMNIASIYYYYESKEALLEDIFSHFEKGYRHYFDWLINENERVDTFEELMDNIFNKEFLEMRDVMGCLGMSLAIKEQHNNMYAHKIVVDLFIDYSISSLQAGFDNLIAKGIIKPYGDTRTIATLVMFCVMVTNDLRLHEFAGVGPTVDHMKIYSGLRKHITSTLQHSGGNNYQERN